MVFGFLSRQLSVGSLGGKLQHSELVSCSYFDNQTDIFASKTSNRAFKAIIISFVSTILVVPIIVSIPEDYPFDKDAVLRSGIDADIVELEPEEKGKSKLSVVILNPIRQ